MYVCRWDPIFQPDGFDQTFAELSSNVKNTISHRYKAVDKLRSYLRDNHESIKTILIQKQT
jgi:inosine triphosphate pyrophosphatase